MGEPSKAGAAARVTTRCGSLLPNSAAAQVSVACTAPADAVALPPSVALATPGASSASASDAPASSALRRRRAFIGPRFDGLLGHLGRLGALLGPRLVELHPPAC